jgi:nitrogen fixation protein FixH
MSSLRPVTTTEQQQERRAWLQWGGLIAGFFVVQFSMSIVAIVLATSDPTHAVIPNYHQQAMAHDKVLSARQASERLGWRWTIALETSSSSSAMNSFTVQLKNQQGQPIEQALVSVDLCHHARGNQRQRVCLTPVENQPGVYRGVGQLSKTGVWQIDMDAQRGEEHFIDREEKFWSFSS